jgi:hypothetical protein
LDINELSLRQLQTETSRALAVFPSTNDALSKFNKLAHHDSQRWYKAVITEYVNLYGDLPSRAGPGVQVKILSDRDV